MAGHPDIVVIGLGGMGAAAAFRLAARGHTVLGLERFGIAHDFGSSGNLTRVWRFAYFEHPAYVPMMARAYDLWRELEISSGRKILWQTGCLSMGTSDSAVVAGATDACRVHGLAHETLDAAEIVRRHRAWRLPDDVQAVFEAKAGFLRCDIAIEAHIEAARRAGAELRFGERVLEWKAGAGGVEVVTDQGRYRAAALVITAGPWAGELLPRLGVDLIAERQVVGWFEPTDAALFRPEAFPVFGFARDDGVHYGFPVHAVPGVKIARYNHRREAAAPDSVNRAVDRRDEAVMRDFARQYLPSADGPMLDARTCLFTNSPDGHFVIDRHPEHPRVVIAAGFSGHGFKFCPAVGEVLADLAIGTAPGLDISLFRLGRFGAGAGS